MKLPIIVSKREAERLRQQNRAAALQRRDDRRGSVPSAQKAAPSQPDAQKSAHASPDTSSVFESASASASLSRSRAEREDEDNRSSVSLRRSRSYRRRTSEQREGRGRSSSSSDDDDDSTSSSRTGSSMRSSPSTSSTSIASAGSSVHGQRNRTAHALPARRPAGVTGAAARPSGTAAGTAAAGAARTQYSTYARKMLNKSRAEEQLKMLSRRSSAVNFDAADAFFDRSDSSVGLDSRASSTLAKDGTPRLRQDDRSDDEEGDEDGGVAREAAHDSVHTQHNGRHGVAENNDEDGGGGRLQQPYRSGTTTGRHISHEEAMRRRVVHDMLEAALIAKQGKGSAPGGGESGGSITAPDTARPRAVAGEQRLHGGPRRGSAVDVTPNTKNKAVVALSATSTTPASSSPADSVTERKTGSSGNSGGGGLLGWSRRLRNSARKSTSRTRNDAASAGQVRQRGSAASAGTSPVAASKTSARSPSSSSSSSINTTSRSAVTQQQQQYSASGSSARRPSSSSSTAATPVQGLTTPNAPPNAANTTTSTTATVAVPAPPPPPPPLAHVARHDQSFSKEVLRSMDNAQLSMLAFNAQKARKSSSRHLRRQASFSSHDGVVARAESTLSLASDGGYGSFVRMPPASPDESLSGRHRSRHSKDNDDDDDDDARSSGSRRGDRHHLYRSSSGRRHSSPTQPMRKMSFFSSLFRSNSNVSTASQRSGRSTSSRSSRRKTRTAHSRSHAAQREVSGGRSTAHSSHRPRAATTSAAVTSVAPAAAAKERHSSHRTLSRRGSASFLDIHDGDYGHGGYGTSLYRTFSSSSIGSQSSRNSRRRDDHYEKKSRSGGSHHTSKRATAAATHQGDEQRRRETEKKKTGKDDDDRLLLQHSQDKDGPYRLRPRRHMSSSSNSITKNNYLNSIEMAGGLGGISSAGSTLHLAHSFGSLFEAAATLGANASGSLYGSSAMSTGIVTASGTASTSSSSSSSSAVATGSVMPMPNSEYGSTAAFGHYASHMAGGDGGGGAAASAGPQGMAAVSSQYSAAMGPRGVSPQPSLPSSSSVGAADAFPNHSYPRAASAAHATGGLGSTGHRGPVHPPHLQQNLVSRLDRPAGAGGSPAYHGRSPHTAGPQTAANKTQTHSRGAEVLDGDEAGMQRMPKVNSIGSRPAAAAATDGSGEAAAREAELDSATPATHVRSSAPSSERPAGQDGSRSDAASYTHKDNTHKSSNSSHRHRSNGADDDDNRDAGSVASRRIALPGGQSHSAADHSSASSSSSDDNISSKSSAKKDNKTAQVEEGDGTETPRNIRQRNSLLSLTEGFRIRRRGSATKAAAGRRDVRQATQAAERRASSNSSSSGSSSSSSGSENSEPRRRAQPPPGKPSGSDPRRSGSSRHLKASVDASAEGSQRAAKRVHSGNSSLLPQPPTLSSSESKNFRTRITNGSAGNLGKNASFVNGTGHSFQGSGAPPLPPQQQAENGGAPPPTRADSRDFLLRSPPEGSNNNKSSSRHPNSNHSSRSRRTQQNNAAPATAASSSSSGRRGTQQTNSAAAAATSGSQGSPHESRRRRSRSRSRSAASSSKNDTSLEFSSDSFLDGRARGRLAKAAAAAAAAASASAGNNAATSGSGERRRRGHGSFSHPTDGSGGAAAAAVPHSSSMRRHRGQHLSREQSMVSSRASSASGRAQSDNGGAKATDEQNRRHRRHRHGGEAARSPDVDLLESLGSQRLRRSRGDIRYGSGRRHHNSSSASMVAGLDEVLPPRHAVVPPSAPSSAGPSSRNSSNSSGERMGNHVGRNSVRCLRKMAAKARDASNTSSCESELRTNAATSVAGGCSNSQINNSSAKHSHSAMVPQIADGSGGVLGRGSAASTSPAIAFFGAAPMNGSGATVASNAMGGGYAMRLPSFKPNVVAESSSSNDVSSDRAANSGGHRQPYPQQQPQQPPSNGDGASVHFHLMPQLMSHDGSPLPYQGSGNYLLQPARRPGSSGNSRLQISVSNGNNNSNNNNSNSNTISATTTQERGHEPAGHDTFKYLAPGGVSVPAGGQRGFVIERTGSTGSQAQSDASGSGFHDGSGGGSGSVGAHTPAFSPLLTQSRDNSAKRRRPTTASFTPWSVDMSRFDKLREAQTESTPTA